MSRLDKKFIELKKDNKKAFIAYVCTGDPDLDFTKKVVLGFDKIGVDIVELGIPFSDPIADGPTIQRASERALKNKVTLSKAFTLVRELRKKSEIPLVFMSYFNPMFRYGLKSFVKEAASSGLDGVIMADLPFEESETLSRITGSSGIVNIPLVAPTTEVDRLKKILRAAQGFIYYVSLTGITGARKGLSSELIQNLKFIKSLTDKPICVGFGISKPFQIRRIKAFCDGVIVGSAIIDVIEKSLNKKDLLKKVLYFTKSLIKATKKY